MLSKYTMKLHVLLLVALIGRAVSLKKHRVKAAPSPHAGSDLDHAVWHARVVDGINAEERDSGVRAYDVCPYDDMHAKFREQFQKKIQHLDPEKKLRGVMIDLFYGQDPKESLTGLEKWEIGAIKDIDEMVAELKEHEIYLNILKKSRADYQTQMDQMDQGKGVQPQEFDNGINGNDFKDTHIMIIDAQKNWDVRMSEWLINQMGAKKKALLADKCCEEEIKEIKKRMDQLEKDLTDTLNDRILVPDFFVPVPMRIKESAEKWVAEAKEARASSIQFGDRLSAAKLILKKLIKDNSMVSECNEWSACEAKKCDELVLNSANHQECMANYASLGPLCYGAVADVEQWSN